MRIAKAKGIETETNERWVRKWRLGEAISLDGIPAKSPGLELPMAT